MAKIGESCLKTITKKFTLDAYGKDKEACVGEIFKKLTKEEYNVANGLIVQAEPLDVVLEDECEKTTAKKILGYFNVKPRQDYYVKLTIEVRLKYIEK